MRDLPRGTVTFLFTDIEGSTRLLLEHGERYPELLSEHRRVLREVAPRPQQRDAVALVGRRRTVRTAGRRRRRW